MFYVIKCCVAVTFVVAIVILTYCRFGRYGASHVKICMNQNNYLFSNMHVIPLRPIRMNPCNQFCHVMNNLNASLMKVWFRSASCTISYMGIMTHIVGRIVDMFIYPMIYWAALDFRNRVVMRLSTCGFRTDEMALHLKAFASGVVIMTLGCLYLTH